MSTQPIYIQRLFNLTTFVKYPFFTTNKSYNKDLERNLNNSVSYYFRTEPQDTACQAMIENRCSWTRGKVLGGSSVLNTMLYIRGNKRDFNRWADYGNYGWSFEEVLPYFKKSQDQRNPYLARDKRHHATGKYVYRL